MAGSLTRTKSIDRLMAEGAATTEGGLKRTLGPFALVALGIVFSVGTLMGIPTESWTPVVVWFAIGLVVYGAMRVRRTENRREVIVRVE